MKYLIFLILISAAMNGCKTTKTNNEGEYKTDKDIEELNNAPERVLIDGKTYIIEPYVWRNLMPVIDPKDKEGLLMSIKVKTQDGSDISDNISASRAWVIRNTDIWATPVSSTELKEHTFKEYYARFGPQWKPEEKVNVIIELDANNKKFLLQAKDQIIQAVY